MEWYGQRYKQEVWIEPWNGESDYRGSCYKRCFLESELRLSDEVSAEQERSTGI